MTLFPTDPFDDGRKLQGTSAASVLPSRKIRSSPMAHTFCLSLTNSFLSELKDFAKIIGLSEEKKKMFEEFFQRNTTTLSMKFIEDVEKSGGVLPLVLEKSAHTKKDINDKNLRLFEKEKELSEKEYLKEKNEDKILFEDYLEAFKEEIK